ncbi:MAG: ABC transporter permease subunit [Chloroflexi bacterium]|nr:ABC transporter permease subunit [Chloroflexota bacterium]
MAQIALPASRRSTSTVSAQKWLGALPFFLFAILFLIWPSARLMIDAFLDGQGRFTLDNLAQLFQNQTIVSSYLLSIQISAVTAIGGGIFGFFLAYSVTIGGLPKPLRSMLITFSAVASNFAGVPLAFAFVATLGRTGFITAILKNIFGVNIYTAGFNLYSFLGLSLTYMYFQFPLMVLIMAPALDALKKEWREAAENLGATVFQYWWHVALPILMPSILGTMFLLFANSFGAYATAYALTGGSLPLITIQLRAQIQGDVLHNPSLGYAMAMGMIIVMAVSTIGYIWLQSRSERWLK